MAKGTLVKIEANGTLSQVRVDDPKGWTVEQLYHLIGCDTVQQVKVRYNEKMRMAFIDENARIALRDRPIPPVNAKATEMYRANLGPNAGPILGVAVIWVPDSSTLSIRKKAKGEALGKV